MPTLHIVNHAEALTSCLEVAAADDSVLLIQEAASCALNDQPRRIIVLEEDLEDSGALGANVESTNYPGFVDLVVSHQPTVSWC